MKKEVIQALREKYVSPFLRKSDLNENPFDQFLEWFQAAIEAKVPEPNAMSLATVSQNNQPTLRVVLFKGLSDRNGFNFYTNYSSRKAKDLLANPFGALTFCWLELGKQIRLEGRIVKLPPEESEAYFHSRPRGSQIGAWVSDQSDVIENREVLMDKAVEIEKRFADMDVIPLPPDWGGYELLPHRIEFWQGNDDRLHDRFVYSNEENNWLISRLAP